VPVESESLPVVRGFLLTPNGTVSSAGNSGGK
jgi:hypothetical protein